MNNTIIFSRVKFFITTKRLIAITLFLLCAVIILFAALLLTRKKSLLIDYLPKDASFWFWQKGGGYDARATEFLELLGFDPKASSILEGRKYDIVIYLKDDEWYRLTADGLEGESSGESAELFRVLTSSRSATIVGSVSADYIEKHFPPIFSQSLNNSPYYFTLSPASKTFSFQITSRDKILQNKIETSINLPDFPSSVILAFQTTETEFQKQGAEYIKKRLTETVAFQHPVIIVKTLPDGTVSKERVVDPTLFSWVSREPNFFDLVVDDKVVFAMYEDEKRVVVASSKQDIIEDNLKDTRITSFFYLNLESVPGIEFVDILGKSSALSWLQKNAVKRIIVGELETHIKGEFVF